MTRKKNAMQNEMAFNLKQVAIKYIKVCENAMLTLVKKHNNKK